MLQFAIQIAQHGKIVNYGSANEIWDEIKSIDSDDWEIYKERYQKKFNSLKSELRKLAPMI